MHGNYDGGGESLASRPVKFDLYIGLDFWYEVTVSDAAKTYTGGDRLASSLSVCLLDTGNGTPFISSLELRPMSSDMYPDAMANQSLGLFRRFNMGESNFLRPVFFSYSLNKFCAGSISDTDGSTNQQMYPDDPYDRFWWAATPAVYSTQWLNISTNATSMNYYRDDHIRVPVAVLRTAVTTSAISVPLNIPQISNYLGRLPPSTDMAYFHFLHFANFDQKPRQFDIYYGNTKWEYRNEPVQLNPMHNGTLPTYYPSDAHSLSSISLVATNASVLPPMLNAIEIYYGIPHNVITTAPDDVDAIMAIKTEYQVKKNWTGDPCLPKEYIWAGLQCKSDGTGFKIISLDLSGNHFDGTLPEALCTKRSLNLRYDTNNGDPCNGKKGKSDISMHPTRTPESGSHVDLKDHIQTANDHEFTNEELVKITNNFSECIGEGGFGTVYRGQLQGNVQVAVKISSRASLHGQGITEFLAEINSLRTVHHKHLVLLIGYCTKKDHLTLIYEYMPNGSLFDHIRGLSYLHSGCVLSIIHRDVKSHNILLGQDMHAKISDFGLSKSYINEAQTHILVTAAGTIGYIDPEYYFSGRLTMTSDVFSFGVILLETVTGEPPIVPGIGHVVQRVKKKVSDGDISAIVDQRLKALLCTREVSDDRPTMTEVVEQLKDALALEEARHIDRSNDNSQGNINTNLSANWGPSSR
uniref:Protein kinase domain-containing protein n=1 Tax=Oryza punctata TaxID=4537 RepID=A0A0E0M094_ORYPU